MNSAFSECRLPGPKIVRLRETAAHSLYWEYTEITGGDIKHMFRHLLRKKRDRERVTM